MAPEEKQSIEDRLTRIERQLVLVNKKVFTVDELALWLGVGEGRIRCLISNKEIPYYKNGGKVYFSKEEIEQWQLQGRVYTNDELQREANTYCFMKDKGLLKDNKNYLQNRLKQRLQ